MIEEHPRLCKILCAIVDKYISDYISGNEILLVISHTPKTIDSMLAQHHLYCWCKVVIQGCDDVVFVNNLPNIA